MRLEDQIVIVLADGPAECIGTVIRFPMVLLPEAVQFRIPVLKPCDGCARGTCSDPGCGGHRLDVVVANYKRGLRPDTGEQMRWDGIPAFFFDGFCK